MPSKRSLIAEERPKRVRRSPRLVLDAETLKTEPEIKIESSLDKPLKEVFSDKLVTTTSFKHEVDDAKVKVEIEASVSGNTDTCASPETESKSNVFQCVSPLDILPGQPKNWNLIYNEVVKMRALIVTPVDTMGCERIPETIAPGLIRRDPRVYRFRLLVSLMLSSQTKDEVTYVAVENLNNFYKTKGFEGLCIEAILKSTEAEIDFCIQKVGFHRRKAVYIKKASELLNEKFNADIPKNIKDTISLPGVGPKMGHLLLQAGWRINLGIGVDVHLHRLAQMWGWVPKSDKPESTRLALEDWLPKKYWSDINPLLVGFGQTVCVPNAGNCDVCTLAAGLCSKANKKLSNAAVTEARLAKLAKQRGDISGLIKLKHELQILKKDSNV